MKKLKLLFITMVLAAVPVCATVEDSTDDGQPSPVPEPSTIALMGAGVAALGFAAWRRNRKR